MSKLKYIGSTSTPTLDNPNSSTYDSDLSINTLIPNVEYEIKIEYNSGTDVTIDQDSDDSAISLSWELSGDNSKYFSIDSNGNVTINSNNSLSIPGDGADATVTVTLTYNGNSLDNNTAMDTVYIDILYCSVIIIAQLSNNEEDTAATIYYNIDGSATYITYTGSVTVPYGTTIYYYATTNNSEYYYTYTSSSPNTETITNVDTTLIITAATDSVITS